MKIPGLKENKSVRKQEILILEENYVLLKTWGKFNELAQEDKKNRLCFQNTMHGQLF